MPGPSYFSVWWDLGFHIAVGCIWNACARVVPHLPSSPPRAETEVSGGFLEIFPGNRQRVQTQRFVEFLQISKVLDGLNMFKESFLLVCWPCAQVTAEPGGEARQNRKTSGRPFGLAMAETSCERLK